MLPHGVIYGPAAFIEAARRVLGKPHSDTGGQPLAQPGPRGRDDRPKDASMPRGVIGPLARRYGAGTAGGKIPQPDSLGNGGQPIVALLRPMVRPTIAESKTEQLKESRTL